MRRLSFVFLSALFLIMLSCDPDTGSTLLAVGYPSGYERTAHTWDDPVPVEGADCQLRTEKADDFDKTRAYDLKILDGDGEVLYTCPGLGHSVVRGEAAGDGSVWISSELWNFNHYNGYQSGYLKKSTLLLVDLTDGSVLFQAELGKNELYLTSRGSICYFYNCGKREQKKFFGLFTIPARAAELYARDMENWDGKTTLHTFDYVIQPDELDEHSVEDQIQFYLDEDRITVSMTAYVQVDKETNAWDHVEKRRVVIPLNTVFT